MSEPSVFISYSHKDEEWKDRLITHLGVLEKQGYLKTWDDRQIEGGDDWRSEIENAMDSAHVIVPMITADFLTSDFILNEEVTKMLERKRKARVRIMPLIVKPCAWDTVKWLKQLQARPKDGRPLMKGDECQIEEDLTAFAKEIFDLLGRVPKEPSTTHDEPFLI
ncbi:MAG: toll/interleukin-1 receptor domain-containing protein, partial [Candidatus Zixiibacteriota bacterium]